MALNNLNSLTEKIYQEGIEKAEEESKKILQRAQKQSEEIVNKARLEADKLLVEATGKADKLAKSTEMELQLKSKQMVNDLKKEIESMLSDRILTHTIEKGFDQIGFLQDAIVEAIKSWEPAKELELTLPKTLEKDLKDKLDASIGNNMSNLRITFGDRLKKGFLIINKSEGYELSFSDQEFVELFTPYLSERVRTLLFEKV